MKSKRLFSFVLVALLLACIVGVGCTDKVAALKQTVATAKLVKADVDAGLATAKAAVEALPPDSPERAGLLEKIAKAEKLSAQISDYIGKTERSISDLEKGQIPAELVAAATTIPYVGPFVPVIAVLLPSIIALFKSGQASKYKEQFGNLLSAWRVGPDLSPEHQAEVNEIVGPKVAPLLDPKA